MEQMTGLDLKIKEMARRIRELRDIMGLTAVDIKGIRQLMARDRICIQFQRCISPYDPYYQRNKENETASDNYFFPELSFHNFLPR